MSSTYTLANRLFSTSADAKYTPIRDRGGNMRHKTHRMDAKSADADLTKPSQVFTSSDSEPPKYLRIISKQLENLSHITNSKQKPIDSMYDLLVRFYETSRYSPKLHLPFTYLLTPRIVTSALIYLNRYCRMAKIKLAPTTIHDLLAVSLYLALNFRQEGFMSPDYAAFLAKTPITAFKLLEADFVKTIASLHISEKTLKYWEKNLTSLTAIFKKSYDGVKLFERPTPITVSKPAIKSDSIKQIRGLITPSFHT